MVGMVFFLMLCRFAVLPLYTHGVRPQVHGTFLEKFCHCRQLYEYNWNLHTRDSIWQKSHENFYIINCFCRHSP